MTAAHRAGRQRSTRTGRRGLVALGAALSLLPLAPGSASAQDTFLDPANPCVDPAPPADFADRGEIAEIHLSAVDCAVAERLLKGFDQDGRRFYRPADSVPRDQLATMLVNTLREGGYGLPAASDQGFTDIEGNTHRDAINILAAIGVVNGVSDDRYEPRLFVRRDQMASLLVQAAEYAYDSDQLDGNVAEFEGGNESSGFVDVPSTNIHDRNIAAANQLIGVATGRSETMYAPEAETRRDQMASFIVRLFDVTQLPDTTLEGAP